MNFKIPKIKITSAKKDIAEEAAPADDASELLDELENGDLDSYAEQSVQPDEAPRAPAYAVSEDQLRKFWACEIAFGLIASLAAVIIAFVG